MKTILVGCGHQGRKYIKILEQFSNLVGIVDINTQVSEKLVKRHRDLFFANLDEALKKLDFDVAVLTIPHYEYFKIITKLLSKSKAIIKDKPFAVSSKEATLYTDLIEKTKKPIFTITQRNSNELFKEAKNLIQRIGMPRTFYYRYFLSQPNITSGWRSNKKYALGGVGLDMGYHVIDIINNFFGIPDKIDSRFGFYFEETAKEQLEDHFSIEIFYSKKQLTGRLDLTRHHYKKEEVFEISGDNGKIKVSPTKIQLYNLTGQLLLNKKSYKAKNMAIYNQFKEFLENINNQVYIRQHVSHHCKNVAFIEKVYKNHTRIKKVL